MTEWIERGEPMTIEEAKTAFYEEKPVVYDRILYNRISALIYRKIEGGGTYLALELEDKSKRSVTIALPDRVELKKEDEK